MNVLGQFRRSTEVNAIGEGGALPSKQCAEDPQQDAFTLAHDLEESRNVKYIVAIVYYLIAMSTPAR